MIGSLVILLVASVSFVAGAVVAWLAGVESATRWRERLKADPSLACPLCECVGGDDAIEEAHPIVALVEEALERAENDPAMKPPPTGAAVRMHRPRDEGSPIEGRMVGTLSSFLFGVALVEVTLAECDDGPLTMCVPCAVSDLEVLP